jgi:hypothetical protein
METSADHNTIDLFTLAICHNTLKKRTLATLRISYDCDTYLLWVIYILLRQPHNGYKVTLCNSKKQIFVVVANNKSLFEFYFEII